MIFPSEMVVLHVIVQIKICVCFFYLILNDVSFDLKAKITYNHVNTKGYE